MYFSVLILAAGRGLRVGGGVPKQFRRLNGETVIVHSLRAFAEIAQIEEFILVYSPADAVLLGDLKKEIAANMPDIFNRLRYVEGGATRAASARAGLAHVGCANVLIHDAARPLVSSPVIREVMEALATAKGAAPAIALSDALWRQDAAQNEGRNGAKEGQFPQVKTTLARDGLYRAQTPQGFHSATIKAAHEAIATANDASMNAADDVEVALYSGVDIAITPGAEDNIKLTYAGDFARAERIMHHQNAAQEIGNGAAHHAAAQEKTPPIAPPPRPPYMRFGNGFDVHGFSAGDGVILCGVRIPFTRKLLGHSDADVGMHAITDAIYGALACGDIGQHFPPQDARWKDASSDIFLRHAVALAQEKGYQISNIDCTLICEAPKIAPYVGAMRARLAAIMAVESDVISVKATTTERLGFTGRGEGIAALANAALVRL